MSKKIILITGASSGIGWSTSKLLSKEGHSLILCGRNEAKLEELSNLMLEIKKMFLIKLLLSPINIKKSMF